MYTYIYYIYIYIYIYIYHNAKLKNELTPSRKKIVFWLLHYFLLSSKLSDLRP